MRLRGKGKARGEDLNLGGGEGGDACLDHEVLVRSARVPEIGKSTVRDKSDMCHLARQRHCCNGHISEDSTP